ncbi:uncharacterized protein LOC111880680 [Lactuca sativa]|uniref:uncharacterized protein LOC111880680 n=1 Tax=Lactuca sativa TaxID=4236 RepID=UPI000CD88742|nr:uncharacterized protein LOC111880680 [Lactuca sativa]
MYLFDYSDDDDMFIFMMCATLNNDREEAHIRLVHDYFADDCVYQSRDFKRRFRLRKNVFVRIANALENKYEFFQMRYDARGKRRITGLQKYVVAIKLMAMGESSYSIDDYMRMSERIARAKKAPDAPFIVKENEYKFGYYLMDGIYPAYSTFVKAFRLPVTPRDKIFKKKQEGRRKDVERAFGVPKSK